MASIPLNNPMVPFIGLIPGGLSIGRVIRIKGQMSHGGSRFAIYVQRGSSTWPDNCSLHLSVRPNENAIVRNHYTNHQWAHEERFGGCPIQPGSYFEITILAEPTFFNVSINGQHFCTFNYRLPVFGNSQYIAIEGNCTLNFVGQETDIAPPPQMAPTPYIPIIGIHPPQAPFIPQPYQPPHHPPGPRPRAQHHHHHHHHHHSPAPPGPPSHPHRRK